jgi:hypothetical protein
MGRFSRRLFYIHRIRIARRLAEFGKQIVDLLLHLDDAVLAPKHRLLPAVQFVKLFMQLRLRLLAFGDIPDVAMPEDTTVRGDFG